MHDLALAIGGMTVQELKERMTLDELNSWELYARENGPMNYMVRLDMAVARAVSPFVKGDISLLMPWPKVSPKQLTIEEAMREWK